MIDGVMIRLFVADWNATVAIAWQITTIAMTTKLVARSSATRQKPGLPTGNGLSHASTPNANATARTASPLTTAQ